MLPSFAGAVTKATTYQFASGDKNGIIDDKNGEWTNGNPGFSFSSNELAGKYGGSGASQRGLSTNVTSSVTSNNVFTNVTKIIVDASSNVTGNTLAVEVGGTQIGKVTSLTKANHQTLEFVSDTPLSGTITFSVTRSAKTIWIAGFEVTTEEANPDLKTAELAFENGEYTFTMGETFVSPQLVKQVTDGDITYSSDNETIATVDAVTGNLTLVSAGTTKITATSAATSTYNVGTASYTLIVAEKAKLGDITVNGSVPVTDVPVEAYAELPIVIAAENSESMSITVMDENTDIVVDEDNLAVSSYTWTPTVVGTYEVEVTANGCGSTTKVNFTLNVTEKPESPVTGLWKKVTSLDAINDATLYIIAGYKESAQTWNTMSGTFNEKNLSAKAVDTYESYIVYEEDAALMNIIKNGEYYNLYLPNVVVSEQVTGGYITCNGSGTNNYSTIQATVAENGASSIKFGDMNENFALKGTFQNTTKNTTSFRAIFSYNAGNNMFSCYADTQQPFCIYEPLTEALEGTLMENGVAVDTEANFELQYQKPRTLTIEIAPKHTAYWHFEEAPKAETPEQIAAEAESEKVFTEYSAENPIELTEAGTLTYYTKLGKYKSAEKVLTVTGSTTSGIAEIGAEAAEAEWFDVQGRRVAKPAKGGVYILKQGSKVSKRVL